MSINGVTRCNTCGAQVLWTYGNARQDEIEALAEKLYVRGVTTPGQVVDMDDDICETLARGAFVAAEVFLAERDRRREKS